jgi:hypothetical protein
MSVAFQVRMFRVRGEQNFFLFGRLVGMIFVVSIDTLSLRFFAECII